MKIKVIWFQWNTLYV